MVNMVSGTMSVLLSAQKQSGSSSELPWMVDTVAAERTKLQAATPFILPRLVGWSSNCTSRAVAACVKRASVRAGARSPTKL